MKILLVDDDVNLLAVTAYALRREGFSVMEATDGEQALRYWDTDHPDMVVLDVGLPRIDGLEVCRHIRRGRSRTDTPVILLTGRTDEPDVLAGFRVGADDYVPKPFSPRELTMRIHAVWRRGARRGALEPAEMLRVGELVLNVEAHEVRRSYGAAQPAHLTPTEFRLLHLLAINAGRVVSAARLVDYAWDYDGGAASLLRSHMSQIRRKLGLRRGESVDIRALPGVGYQLCTGPSAG